MLGLPGTVASTTGERARVLTRTAVYHCLPQVVSSSGARPLEDIMYDAFAPMSSNTIRLAKSYRDDQIRAADQSLIASEFRNPRGGTIRRVRAWLTGLGTLGARTMTRSSLNVP